MHYNYTGRTTRNQTYYTALRSDNKKCVFHEKYTDCYNSTNILLYIIERLILKVRAKFSDYNLNVY